MMLASTGLQAGASSSAGVLCSQNALGLDCAGAAFLQKQEAICRSPSKARALCAFKTAASSTDYARILYSPDGTHFKSLKQQWCVIALELVQAELSWQTPSAQALDSQTSTRLCGHWLTKVETHQASRSMHAFY